MNISIINGNINIYSSSKSFSILSYFFIDDIGGRNIESLINWLKDDRYKSAVLNYSYITKNNNKIRIYCFYDGYEREEHKDRDKFEIEKSELIRLAMQWQDVYLKKPTYIKITKEDDGVFLIGKFDTN